MKYFEVFFTALKLGLTSFGGPIAHLSYFREEYVKNKKWISESAYADLVALCQFLPGPASSQVGMAIGYSRAGLIGAIVSWLGFTLPSALILILFGLSLGLVDLTAHNKWLHGLKVVAVSVVAQAILGMGKKLCPDKERATIAIVSSVFVLLFPSAWIQILVLLFAGTIGMFFLKSDDVISPDPIHKGSHQLGFLFLTLFFVILLCLPFIRMNFNFQELNLFDSFYRSGALVFGGGHVVLPLLQNEVVPPGWVSNDIFMAGYGAANAIPGPLFAFSAYLGSVMNLAPNGWLGGILCLFAVFLPSFLLIIGVLPFWQSLRNLPKIQSSMLGLNAAVVGILLAALYNPVWTNAIFTAKDFSLAAVYFLALENWKIPSWFVVFTSVILSFLLF